MLVDKGRVETGLADREAVAAIGTERGFTVYVGWATILRAWAHGIQQASTEATGEIRQGINASQPGSVLVTPYWLISLADIHDRLGRPHRLIEGSPVDGLF